MELCHSDHRLQWTHPSSPHRVHKPFTADTRSHYSKDLIKLVEDCISYLPRDRPTLEEIRSQLLEVTGIGTGVDHAAGLRFAGQTDPRWQQFPLLNVEEEYKLGTAFVPAPPPPPAQPSVASSSPSVTQSAGAIHSSEFTQSMLEEAMRDLLEKHPDRS